MIKIYEGTPELVVSFCTPAVILPPGQFVRAIPDEYSAHFSLLDRDLIIDFFNKKGMGGSDMYSRMQGRNPRYGADVGGVELEYNTKTHELSTTVQGVGLRGKIEKAIKYTVEHIPSGKSIILFHEYVHGNDEIVVYLETTRGMLAVNTVLISKQCSDILPRTLGIAGFGYDSGRMRVNQINNDNTDSIGWEGVDVVNEYKLYDEFREAYLTSDEYAITQTEYLTTLERQNLAETVVYRTSTSNGSIRVNPIVSRPILGYVESSLLMSVVDNNPHAQPEHLKLKIVRAKSQTQYPTREEVLGYHMQATSAISNPRSSDSLVTFHYCLY